MNDWPPWLQFASTFARSATTSAGEGGGAGAAASGGGGGMGGTGSGAGGGGIASYGVGEAAAIVSDRDTVGAALSGAPAPVSTGAPGSISSLAFVWAATNATICGSRQP